MASLRAFFRDEKPQLKSDRVEYSFDASPVMNVPGDWNTQRDQLMFYEGHGLVPADVHVSETRGHVERSSILARSITVLRFI